MKTFHYLAFALGFSLLAVLATIVWRGGAVRVEAEWGPMSPVQLLEPVPPQQYPAAL